MKQGKKRKSILIITGILLLSLFMGGSALARPAAPISTDLPAQTPAAPATGDVPADRPALPDKPVRGGGFAFGMDAPHSEEMLAKLKTRLDEMVTQGILTQEKADEMYKAAEEGGQSFHIMGQGPIDREEMLAKLKENLDAQVAAGELTQEEADARYQAAQEGKGNFCWKGEAPVDSEEMLLRFKARLDEMVTQGILKQEKADELYKAAEEGDFSGLADIMKPEKLSREEMLAKLKENLDAQVAAGELTQEEADARYQAAQEDNLPGGWGGMKGRRGPAGRGNDASSFTQGTDL